MKPEITFTIECLPEDQGVRGNFTSGDDASDRALEDSIIADLESGNEWAWCIVRVEASLTIDGATFKGDAILGGCSYKSEADFRESEATGYLADLKEEARDSLKAALSSAIARGEAAKGALRALK